MAGRPAKSAAILTLTNDVSHRTKREIALRAAAEKGTLTGEAMRESPDVRNDPEAHKEFMRVRKLLRKIDKDDAIYGRVINDYCLLYSQRRKLTELIGKIDTDLDDLEERSFEMEPKDYYELRAALLQRREKLQQQQIVLMDKMRSIEDKNLMNIQSALRSIPKKPDEKKNPLKEALSG